MRAKKDGANPMIQTINYLRQLKPSNASMPFLAFAVIFAASDICIAKNASYEDLADKIISMRADVEALQDEVESNKEQYRSTVQSLNIQKADLSASIQREKMQIDELSGKLKLIKHNLDQKFVGDEALVASLKTAMTDVKAYIETSLPFKKNERLSSLEKLRVELENKQINPYKAASHLWAFIEDEIRLHKDTGLYKQVLKIDGSDQLVDIVKVGMIGVYYKTDKQVGLMAKNEGNWIVVPLDNTEDIEAVDYIFDAVKKGIRVGSFKLPSLLKLKDQSI